MLKYTYMSVYAPTSIVRRWFDGYRPPSPAGWPNCMRNLAGSDS